MTTEHLVNTNPLISTLEQTLGQQRLAMLQSLKVGIGGAGGLGSNAAMHLVRSGFRTFVIADFDQVEGGNLNRQFYFADQIGRPKVLALGENLKRINPDLDLSLKVQRVTEENIIALFEGCDIWIEAFDTVIAKKLFVETGAKLGKLTISASGLAGWGDTDLMQTRRLGQKLTIVGDFKSEISTDTPPMSPKVGVAAAKEADVVLSWALGQMAD